MSRRRPAAPAPADARFWGEGQENRSSPERIRPTPDPGAVVRSLGNPPLSVGAATARRHLDAVYEEVVRAATALAAANDLLDDPDA